MKDTTPIPKGDLEEQIGRQFRYRREQKGLTLVDLVEALGCGINTIRWHESGACMMRVDMIHRAASAMGVSPATLITPMKKGKADGGKAHTRHRN